MLLPGFVRTRLAESTRNRASRFGRPRELSALEKERGEFLAALIQAGMDPLQIARMVMTAIRDNDLYVFTHPELRPFIEEHFKNILAAHDKCAAGLV